MFGGCRQEWEEQEWVMTSKLAGESWRASAVSGDEAGGQVGGLRTGLRWVSAFSLPRLN